ncbi:TonB-dependent receptor [Olivibacter sp. SA151]|uniref:SusC/RagA family TonB-linked outer membrane protein n=1 Tax=Olivibacter jilunii TaxID=985016 RepID=UPI003F174564
MKKERIIALTKTAMRISFIQALLISVGTLSAYAHTAEAQGALKKTISITKKRMTLKNFLENLETQSQVKFVYSPSILKSHRIVEVGSLQSNLADVLEEVLAPMDINYKVENEKILLIQNRQELKIVGKVTDATDNAPLPGVSVLVKGSTNGILTDNQGQYSLTVKANDILVVSYVGYTSQEVRVSSGKTTYNISLQSTTSDLDEVVVTGYSAQRKKDLTGAVAVVDIGQLKSQPAASPVEALQGKATGVQIVSDGAPGATPQIRIRGYSTINNNDPLYVIDGVPYEGKLGWLNSNDIESMQVLKDASAASIYGARANNGVVIVTTRKGTKGKATIGLDAYYGVQQARSSAFPDMLNPQQWAENLYQGYRNAGLDPVSAWGRMYGSGDNPVLPDYLLAGGKVGAQITAADVDPALYNYSRDNSTFYQITQANKVGTNWFKELTQSAPMQSYQLSASGGSDDATYAMSGGYFKQEGVVINTGFQRFNFRSNTQFSAFNKKLRIGENAQYSYTENYGIGSNVNVSGDYQGEGSVLGFAYRIQNIIPVYDIMGNFAGSRGGALGNGENPVAISYRAKDDKSKSNTFFGNAFAEYDIIEGLMLRTSFGIRYENWGNIDIVYPNPEFQEGSFNNALTENQGYNTEWTWTNTLNYKPKLGDNHSLNVLLGTEAFKSRSRQLTGGRNNFFILNSLDYLYLSQGSSNISNNSLGNVGSLFSLFGKADYAFKDRYLLSLTVRRDGSSNFGPDNLYGVFPAASAAWRLSEEEFLKDATWLSDLKIRAGYGVTGNQRIPTFQYLNRFSSTIAQSSYPMGGSSFVTGIYQNAYSNQGIKWEEVKSLNLGLDFTLLNGDFDGSFDWYNRKTSDMLYQLPLPAIAIGLGTSPYVNVGDMQNKGVELSLGYHYGRSQQKPFTLDVTANISRNVNEVVSLAPSVTQQVYGNFRSLQTTILKDGAPFGSFYGYNMIGIYQDEEDLANSPTYSGARVGGPKYADISGNGTIGPEDRDVIGNPHPDFVYSLGINAAYKNFDVQMFFNGSQGNDLYEATRYFTDFGTFAGQTSTRLLNAWSPTNTGSMTPSPYQGASDFEYASSSYYVQDGSFFRMKNFQIGYNFPVKTLFGANTEISRFRVYLGATNLFTITNYTGLDPEVSQTNSTFQALGVDFGVYPVPRQYMIGLNIGF